MFVFYHLTQWFFLNVCLSAYHFTFIIFCQYKSSFFRADDYFEWIWETLSIENLCEFQFLCFKHSSQITKFRNLIIAASQKKGALIREGAAIQKNTVTMFPFIRNRDIRLRDKKLFSLHDFRHTRITYSGRRVYSKPNPKVFMKIRPTYWLANKWRNNRTDLLLHNQGSLAKRST